MHAHIFFIGNSKRAGVKKMFKTCDICDTGSTINFMFGMVVNFKVQMFLKNEFQENSKFKSEMSGKRFKLQFLGFRQF